MDAFLWLREQADDAARYDAVIVDLPDPSNFSIGKLYSTTFYRLLARRIAPGGLITVQSTSPARRAQVVLVRRQHARGRRPSDGALPRLRPILRGMGLRDRLRRALRRSRRRFRQGCGSSTGRRPGTCSTSRPTWRASTRKVQRLDDQVLVHYFDEEWSRVPDLLMAHHPQTLPAGSMAVLGASPLGGAGRRARPPGAVLPAAVPGEIVGAGPAPRAPPARCPRVPRAEPDARGCRSDRRCRHRRARRRLPARHRHGMATPRPRSRGRARRQRRRGPQRGQRLSLGRALCAPADGRGARRAGAVRGSRHHHRAQRSRRASGL